MSLLLFLSLAPGPRAQPVDLPGTWTCTVESRSDDPKENYGLELEMRIGADGSLTAKGKRIIPGGLRPADNFSGAGRWVTRAAAGDTPELVEFSVWTVTLGPIVWVAAPVEGGHMYHFLTRDSAEGQTVHIETQCGHHS
ncbi:hypothetical protein [Pseudooceanicola sp. LIPI14-2-Ac024]|uniref:hypothetical protein n=1 Tax=Pseudooceanicola sp. LIPI14-2-Ac024 TaxID=3344875 RepID=UPI0035D0C271